MARRELVGCRGVGSATLGAEITMFTGLIPSHALQQLRRSLTRSPPVVPPVLLPLLWSLLSLVLLQSGFVRLAGQQEQLQEWSACLAFSSSSSSASLIILRAWRARYAQQQQQQDVIPKTAAAKTAPRTIRATHHWERGPVGGVGLAGAGSPEAKTSRARMTWGLKGTPLRLRTL